jgi:hypothetical protein
MLLMEKLELCEGLSERLDRILHAMYVTRQPYCQQPHSSAGHTVCSEGSAAAQREGLQ